MGFELGQINAQNVALKKAFGHHTQIVNRDFIGIITVSSADFLSNHFRVFVLSIRDVEYPDLGVIVLLQNREHAGVLQGELEAFFEFLWSLGQYSILEIAPRFEDRLGLCDQYISVESLSDLLKQNIQNQWVRDRSFFIRFAANKVRFDNDFVLTFSLFGDSQKLKGRPA